jgi:hypothetical protein
MRLGQARRDAPRTWQQHAPFWSGEHWNKNPMCEPLRLFVFLTAESASRSSLNIDWTFCP